MNQNNCDKTTNNFYFNCPPKMADGRLFTSYEPHREYNYKLKHELSFVNQKDYRNKMQESPNMYMDIVNQNTNLKKCDNVDFETPPPARVYRCTKDGCEFYDTNLPNGIGIMEERQWNEIQKMKVNRKTPVAKCKPEYTGVLATSEQIKNINRMALYGGSPLDLYYQNQ